MRIAFTSLLLASPLVAAAATSPPPAAGDTTLTPERAVRFRRPTDLQFSPDGKRLALVVTAANGANPESHVWLLDLATGRLRDLTLRPRLERSPRWSPDGRRLAFLSRRDNATQVYARTMEAAKPGPAIPLTRIAGSVSAFSWSPDGTRIAYLAPAPRSGAEEARARAGYDGRVADREADRERLWVVELKTGRTRRVTGGSWRIDEFEWLDDGRLLVSATDRPAVEAWNGALYLVAEATGAFTPWSRPGQPFGNLSLSPDRSMLAYAGTRRGGPIPHDLMLQAIAGGAARDASATLDRPVLDIRWQDARTPVVRVADGFRYRLFRVTPGAPPEPIDLPLSPRAFDVAGNGTIAFVGVAFDRLPELFLRHPDGTVRQVSQLQRGWTGIRLRDAAIFRLRSFDGTPVEAALLQPPARSGAGKLPLVLLVHGGPASAFAADYFWFNAWAQLLAAHGYQVLLVNPRGSAGYGERFTMANRGDWGGGDWKDLMVALDSVVARGGTDTTRMGIGGWSYGGEMVAWAVGHTARFRAAVAGAPVFDQAAEFGTEASSVADSWYFGNPWDHPEVFARNSPSSFIRSARTPTLLFHGEEDTANPPGQSLAFYRALKHYRVPAELVIYPRENHLPREESHQIDILRRMLAWYDRYLGAGGS